MNKYKVCVYAICKNEEKFIDRWYESMKEADSIYVLDTGSTDNSYELLKEKGVNVFKKEIIPWRFDVARNEAMKLIPDDVDICVSTDLDEVYEKGWRKKVENAWNKNTNRLRHTYNWRLVNNKPVVTFYYEKIHDRYNYKWIHPVHEVLEFNGKKENKVTIDNLILNHYPDESKSRGNYLKLLELSVKEEPNNDRNMHYLGREYMYYHEYDKAINTLIKHLNLKSATWKDERAASMRFIGRSYFNMKRLDEAKIWYLKAINEAPYLRDGYVELSFLYYNTHEWYELINILTKALTIKTHEKSYINEVFSWDYTIDNFMSIAYYNIGLYDISLFYINRALKYNNKLEMLINNKKIIEEKIRV